MYASVGSLGLVLDVLVLVVHVYVNDLVVSDNHLDLLLLLNAVLRVTGRAAPIVFSSFSFFSVRSRVRGNQSPRYSAASQKCSTKMFDRSKQARQAREINGKRGSGILGSGTPTRSSATTTAFYISTLFLLNRS